MIRTHIWPLCNPPDNEGDTPIHYAAKNGYTEIVKILAPLTDSPNAPNNTGKTPIYWAALKGHEEIVKILAPFTGNPNAPNNYADTPNLLPSKIWAYRNWGSCSIAANTEVSLNILLETYSCTFNEATIHEMSSENSLRPTTDFICTFWITKL